jgi:hypothetical protein
MATKNKARRPRREVIRCVINTGELAKHLPKGISIEDVVRAAAESNARQGLTGRQKGSDCA